MAAACTSRLSSRAPAVASSSGRIAAAPCRLVAPSRSRVVLRSHKVEIEHQGTVTTLEVPDGKSILEVALDKGLDLPHDCKLGVCMTCPAKLVSPAQQQQRRAGVCLPAYSCSTASVACVDSSRRR
jgi:ferredoxin